MLYKRNRRNRAQTAMEYALMIFAIIGGLVAMRMFYQRAQQGRLKEELTKVGQQFNFNEEDGIYNYTWTKSRDITDTAEGGWSVTNEDVVDGVKTTTIDERWKIEDSEESWGDGDAADLPPQ